MSPKDLYYTKEHEWARVESDGSLAVGITEHAQESLGDVVYVELPEVGDEVASGDEFGTVESVKAVSELFSPCDGEVLTINEKLEDSPELINSDPYGDGWLITIKLTDPTQLEELMDADTYDAFVESEG